MKAKAYLCTIHVMLASVVSAGASAQAPQNSARAGFPIPPSVRVVRDIPYAKYGTRELKLDLYLPPGSDDRRTMPGVNDVKAAVRWMRAHTTMYRIDPNAIGAIGGSAGAHLVAMLATSGGVND